jgi:signal transduction histidine kinase
MLFGLLRGRIEPLFESEEIRILWRVGDLPQVSHLAPEQNLHLLRILQEAFSNAIKHAEATEIEFSTDWQEETLILRVRDNGHGFGESKPSGRGLPHMQTRAKALDAEIDFQSSEGGTCVEIRLPLE